MSKRQLLIILGAWVMIFLFLNIPSTWDKVFALVTGLLIILIALKFKTSQKNIPTAPVPYVEHKNAVAPQPNARPTTDPIINSNSPMTS